MVDETGALVDGDEILFIIAKSRHQRGHDGGVVGTLMTNLGLEKALADMQFHLCERMWAIVMFLKQWKSASGYWAARCQATLSAQISLRPVMA